MFYVLEIYSSKSSEGFRSTNDDLVCALSSLVDEMAVLWIPS